MTVSLVSWACAAPIHVVASSAIPAAAERLEIMCPSFVLWSQHRSGVDIPSPECRLHLAPHLHGGVVRIIVDVGPFHRRTFGDIALELDVVRQTQRQQAF